MTRKKRTQQKSNSILLKTPKEIRECTVVLYDIALETDLIQRYQLHIPLKKEKLSKQSASCVNTSLYSNIHVNKQSIKENVQKKNAIENRRHTITKNSKKKGKNDKKIKSQRSGKDTKINKNISLSHQYYGTTPKFILSKYRSGQQLIHHSDVKSFSSTNTDETSSTSTDTHFTYMQKMAILMNNKNNINVRKLSTEKIKKLDSKRMLHLNKPDGTCGKFIFVIYYNIFFYIFIFFINRCR